MSRPHGSKDLWFAKHPTKPSTYVPKQAKAQTALGWLAVLLGTAMFCYAMFLISTGLWFRRSP
jgi:uncharacterized membrane protein